MKPIKQFVEEYLSGAHPSDLQEMVYVEQDYLTEHNRLELRKRLIEEARQSQRLSLSERRYYIEGEDQLQTFDEILTKLKKALEGTEDMRVARIELDFWNMAEQFLPLAYKDIEEYCLTHYHMRLRLDHTFNNVLQIRAYLHNSYYVTPFITSEETYENRALYKNKIETPMILDLP